MEKAKKYIKNILKMDWKNEKTGMGGDCDKNKSTEASLDYKTENELETIYRVDDVAKNIVNKLPKAAFEKGFDLMPNDIPQYDFFWNEWKRLKLEEKVLKAWIWGRLYGNSVLILDIEDGQERNLPVDWNKVRDIRWAQILEKRYYDVREIGSKPNSDYYRKPLIISVQSNNIPSASENREQNKENTLNNVEFHASRCVFFDGEEIPWYAYQENDFCHDSVLQQAFQPIANYASAYSGASQMMHEIRERIYKIPGWAEIVASGQQDKVEQRLQALNQTKSVYKLLVMDEDENYESNTVSLSGIHEMLDKFGRRVVQAANAPHTIVLGEGSTGNTSGRTETEQWADQVAQEQVSYLKPKLQRLIQMIFAQSEAPKMPSDMNEFEIQFPSIITRRDSDKVADYKSVSEADDKYIANGVMTPDDARKRFTEDGFKLDITLDPIEEDNDEPIDTTLPSATENLDQAETFIPTAKVAENAAKGLLMRRQYGRGGTNIGVARARDLQNQKAIPLETISRMVSFFARHEQNKNSTTENGDPGNGQIAWMLWGGDEGQTGANEIFKQSKEKNDESEIQTIIFLKSYPEWKMKNNVMSWLIDNGFKPIKPACRFDYLALLFLPFSTNLGNEYDDCKSIGAQASQTKSL